MSKRSNADIILEAIQDLHAQDQVVTRSALEEATGLTRQIIDDRVGHLIDVGLVIRVERGVYVPAAQHPPARIISKMVLPDGTAKIEIGDIVLTLTPREDRALGALMAGAGHQFAAIGLGRLLEGEVAALSAEVRRLSRELAKVIDERATVARRGGA